MTDSKKAWKVKDADRPKNSNRSSGERHTGSGAKGLTLGFMVFVILFVAGSAFFVLVQRRGMMGCEVKARRIESKIAMEKSRQERLRLSLAKLKSPGRVARIASDELGLTEPAGVIYLKYERDAQGNMICQSTFEERSLPEPPPEQEPEQREEGGQDPVEDGPAPLTRR